MRLRTPKLHQKTLNKFSIHIFTNWKGHKSLSVRDHDSKRSLETYVLSAELSQFENLKARIIEAEKEKKPITIKFVRKFNRKYINEVS